MAHEQRAVGDEGHGHGLVALDRGGRHEPRRIGVDTVAAQVHVVQAEALGHRTGELVVVDRTLRQQYPLRRRARRVGGLHRVVHHLPLDEPEVDDDVGQHAPGASASRRRSDAVAALSALGWCCPGLSWRIHS
jgi:hypothetical protein